MSKITAAALCIGAAGGAAVTALLMKRANSSASASAHTSASTPSSTSPSPMAGSRQPPFSQPPSASTAAVATPSSAPVDPAGIYQYGFPGPIADLRTASSLVSSFDRRTRNPSWVAEHITPESLAIKTGDRVGSVFYEDESIPEKFRAKLSDYFRSGYDRGHQVAAADAKWSQQAMDDTFALSNMCPQVGQGFNRDYWAHFEDFCRRLTKKYPSVRIVTGPLYLPKKDAQTGKWKVEYEVIGSPPNVAVPTHFYKVIYAETSAPPAPGKPGNGQAQPSGVPVRNNGPVALAAFVMPNAPIPNTKPLTDFEVPVEMVERAAGLEFMALLPPSLRRRLCADVDCSIIVKEYPPRDNNRKGDKPQRS